MDQTEQLVEPGRRFAVCFIGGQRGEESVKGHDETLRAAGMGQRRNFRVTEFGVSLRNASQGLFRVGCGPRIGGVLCDLIGNLTCHGKIRRHGIEGQFGQGGRHAFGAGALHEPNERLPTRNIPREVGLATRQRRAGFAQGDRLPDEPRLGATATRGFTPVNRLTVRHSVEFEV